MTSRNGPLSSRRWSNDPGLCNGRGRSLAVAVAVVVAVAVALAVTLAVAVMLAVMVMVAIALTVVVAVTLAVAVGIVVGFALAVAVGGAVGIMVGAVVISFARQQKCLRAVCDSVERHQPKGAPMPDTYTIERNVSDQGERFRVRGLRSDYRSTWLAEKWARQLKRFLEKYHPDKPEPATGTIFDVTA